MKRTFPANIDGQVFYIDEDAYELLNNYLHQLGTTFRGEEGREIVADIESRIRELFTEGLAGGKSVIVLADVQSVITTMGRPEELDEHTSAYGDIDVQVPPAPESAAGQSTLPPPPKAAFRRAWEGLKKRHRLFRNMQDKVFGGVFGGLAVYLGWNANIMRVLYAVLTCCTYFWPLTIIYLIAWMIIPPALTPRQVLEMKGEPVNVDSIGQTLITPPAYQEDAGHIITNALKVAARVLMAFVGFFSGIGLFGCAMAFICLVTGLIAFGAFGSVTILHGMDLFHNGIDLAALWLYWWGILISLLVAILILGALLWASCSVVFKTRGASRNTVITWFIVLAVLIAASICLFSAYHGIV